MYKKTDGWPINILTGGAVDPKIDKDYQNWIALGNTLEYTLSDAKALKLEQIVKDRDEDLYKNVSALNNTWQVDSRSQELLVQAITLGSITGVVPSIWRTSDNIDVGISSINDLVIIASTIAVQVEAAYTRSWSRKADLALATTLLEVESI